MSAERDEIVSSLDTLARRDILSARLAEMVCFLSRAWSVDGRALVVTRVAH